MQEQFTITRPLISKLLSVVDAGLVEGVGEPTPGNMCVEAAVCYALDLPHGDEPPCVHPAIRTLKIALNDSSWSSNTARAKGMRRLAVLQLGTADCGFDAVEFAKRVALATVKVVLPIALNAVGLAEHAQLCSTVTTLNAAADAARAAADAADAAARAAAYAAARAAAYAAAYAADAAARDNTLLVFAKEVENTLIEMQVPGVQFLDMV